MNIIEQNPYRVLGCVSNSSKKEIVANFGKIKAFLKTNKAISFENDFSAIIKPVIRTEESSAQAYSAVTLPKDKLSAGMFWLMQLTDQDKVALSYLRNGDFDNAILVLREKPTVSSCVNLAVINLIKQNWTTALYYYVYLLSKKEKRTELLSVIADNPELLTEKEVVQVFVDKLMQSFPDVQWMDSLNQKEVLLGDKAFDINDFFLKSNVYEYLAKKESEADIEKIELALAKASAAEGENALLNLEAAKCLEKDTKLPLRSLRTYLGKSNATYSTLCDKIANQIINNCIDYYNHDSGNPSRPRNIIRLLRYAMRTAEGKMAKDRSKNNYEIIKEEYDALIPEEIEKDVAYINKQIAEFKKYNSISNYAGYLNSLLSNCYQKLEVIRINVGKESPHYVKISSKVVCFAIDVITDEVKSKEKVYNNVINGWDSTLSRSEKINLRKTLEWGKNIFDTLNSFAKDAACTERYDGSLKFLESLYNKCLKESFDTLKNISYSLEVSVPSYVYVLDTFSVRYFVNYKGSIDFSSPSYSGLDILMGPLKKETQGGTEYSFIFKANNVGTYVITPAAVKINGRVFKSSAKSFNVVDKVKPQKTETTQKQTTTEKTNKQSISSSKTNKEADDTSSSKGLLVCAIMFIILVLVLAYSQRKSVNSTMVESLQPNVTSSVALSSQKEPDVTESITPEVSSTYEEPEPQYNIVYYKTGDRPYQSYYGKGRYDSDTENSLLIKNGSTSDAVVFLETLSGRKIRHVYVCKGGTFKMTQIPGGKYITKMFQGNSWNPDKYNGENAPQGGFMEDISMSKSEEYDPFDYPYPSSGEYYAYEITLYKVTNGNMHTENIDTNEMF